MSLPTYEEMLNKRLHIGHFASKWNPRFAPFVLTKKNDRHIINLKHTQDCLQTAAKKMQEIVQSGGKILFVGTKKQAKMAAIEASNEIEGAYIVERWLGGTLTNFGTIYKSIKKLSKMDDLQDDPAYKNLTKKEQSIIQGKRIKLQTNLAGIKDLNRLPQALFVIDIKREITAIKEAKKLNIPIFAIADTNTDPTLVDYPIPANDDSKASIQFILQYLTKEVKPSLQAWKEAKTAPKKDVEEKPKATNTKKAAVPKETKETATQKEKTTSQKETKKESTAKSTTTTTAPMDKKAKLAALKQLRDRTKAGVMDCQVALTEANGDIEKAVDILYTKIKKKAEKLSQNKTEQNFVFGDTNSEKNVGVLIQLSCQTDFVGNSQDFTKIAKEIVTLAIEKNPSSAAKLLELKIGNRTIQELINFWIAAFGENIILSDYQRMEGEYISCFVHSNKKTGSLVETNKTAAVSKEKDNPVHHVAMQIALNKPMGITPQDVADKLQAGGKKIPNVEKIAEGKALLTQPFFQQEDKTVSEYLKELDPTLTIKAFIRAPQTKVGKK